MWQATPKPAWPRGGPLPERPARGAPPGGRRTRNFKINVPGRAFTRSGNGSVGARSVASRARANPNMGRELRGALLYENLWFEPYRYAERIHYPDTDARDSREHAASDWFMRFSIHATRILRPRPRQPMPTLRPRRAQARPLESGAGDGDGPELTRPADGASHGRTTRRACGPRRAACGAGHGQERSRASTYATQHAGRALWTLAKQCTVHGHAPMISQHHMRIKASRMTASCAQLTTYSSPFQVPPLTAWMYGTTVMPALMRVEYDGFTPVSGCKDLSLMRPFSP